MKGYFDSPWPGEDGGPQRLQAVASGFAAAGNRIGVTTRRTLMSTMTVLGAPGEVFLLTHDALRARIGLPTSSRVARIDPITLATTARSPRLPGGPMWPGGMAVHANGDLYVVYGRWVHRLGRDCALKASLRLPVNAAYNSFVVLDCGLIVTKNLSDQTQARLSVIDPETLTEVAVALCPEASIARLSAVGDTVYVVGVTTIRRYDWVSGGLREDQGWAWQYLAGSSNSYGWDGTLAAGHGWFMDNGRHRYRTTMAGAGVSPTANRLHRVNLRDAGDHESVTISGLPGGSITNPPLVDVQRGIVIGYDSANRYLAAWDWDGKALTPRWQKANIGCASHMLLCSESGDLITNDHGRGGEWLVSLDVETGLERGRVHVGGMTQGVVFPSPGWNRDVYWCSMRRLARVFIA